MTLIVENGSVVANADSFISVDDARNICVSLGLPLDVDDTIAQTQLRQAYIWLVNLYDNQLQGDRISIDQTGIFPRSGVIARGFSIDSDTIPSDIINAQVFGASAIGSGVDINKVKTTADLASFSVDGVYSEAYKDNDRAPSIASIPQVYNFVKPYCKSQGIGLYREEY